MGGGRERERERERGERERERERWGSKERVKDDCERFELIFFLFTSI